MDPSNTGATAPPPSVIHYRLWTRGIWITYEQQITTETNVKMAANAGVQLLLAKNQQTLLGTQDQRAQQGIGPPTNCSLSLPAAPRRPCCSEAQLVRDGAWMDRGEYANPQPRARYQNNTRMCACTLARTQAYELRKGRPFTCTGTREGGEPVDTRAQLSTDKGVLALPPAGS